MPGQKDAPLFVQWDLVFVFFNGGLQDGGMCVNQ